MVFEVQRYVSSWHFRGWQGIKNWGRNSQRKMFKSERKEKVRKERAAHQVDIHLLDFKSIPFLFIHRPVWIKLRSLEGAPVLLFSLSPPAGESVNPRVAGLIGRSGPQNKQPFMVAFFKATEVHLRSIRSASGGGKQRNPNRSKGAKSQEALRVANVAGNLAKFVCCLYTLCWFMLFCWVGLIWLLLAVIVQGTTYKVSNQWHANTHKNP